MKKLVLKMTDAEKRFVEKVAETGLCGCMLCSECIFRELCCCERKSMEDVQKYAQKLCTLF